MIYSNIRTADLNLLVVFQVLIEERNVTRAARKMNLTQPAMSRAFSRLRDLFKDEILVRTRTGYQPTSRAIQIAAELDFTLPRLERLLGKKDFVPSQAKGAIRIAATDYAVCTIFPGLLKKMELAAPDLKFEIQAWHDDAFADLAANHLDLALWVHKAPVGLKSELLFREELVCLVRKSHPIGNRPLSLKRYLEFSHIVVSVLNNSQLVIERALAERGYERKVLVRTPYFASAAFLLNESDGILTVGKRLAKRMSAFGQYRVLSPPVELAPYDYLQIWHPRTDSDPLLQWIRGQIKASVWSS